MSLANNMILDIYSIIIIIIICFHAYRSFDNESLQDKIFMRILYFIILMLVVDILSRFDGKAHTIYPLINSFGNFMIFLMNPILPSLWLVYVYTEIYKDGRKINRIRYPLYLVNVINVIVLIVSQFYGWYYYIDSNNIYHRGSYFMIPAGITIVIVFTAFVLTLLNYKRLERKSFISLIFFALSPFLGIILQIMFYGVSLVLNSVVFSVLVVFINIQNNGMYTDHLTGVNNRKKLDGYLRGKICSKNGVKGFSAILIDINNFKYINDTYGHNTGDHALEITAKILKSCLSTRDFIARFGGDEFCIILEVSSRSELETMVYKINSCLEKYNRSSSQPYQISLSIGYAVYDYHSHMSAEEFLKQVDLLMYEDKHSYKNKLSMNC